MNAIEIYKAQEEIALEKYNECKARLAQTAEESKTEKKALHIELGMYSLCLRAGLFDRGGTAPDHAQTALAHRNKFIPKIIAKYPRASTLFRALPAEERESFISAVQAEMYMRNQIYENYLSELEDAKAADDAASIFELKIKTGALESVFEAWEAWRKKTGVYPNMFKDTGIADSYFYTLAYNALKKESKRLEAFCESLNKAPELKKEQIAEYKCAKYRYAGVSSLQAALYNNNYHRKLHDLKYSHYLLLPFDEFFKKREDYVALYESAPESEKPEYSLYYGMLAFTEVQISELEAKLPLASDWERIELSERIGGLRFGAECLGEAWEKRGE